MKSIFVLVLFILVILFSSTQADYHYASHEGSNEYPYTSWETAADSIQKAIDAADAGDTVYVGSGVWEDGPYNLWDSLALIGMGMDSTIIHGFMQLHHLYINDYTLVEGFQFENCGNAIKPHLYDSSLVIKNNRFYSNHIAIMVANVSGEIVNNIFQDIDTGIDGSFAPCSLLVENNTFFSNFNAGILGIGGQWTIANNLFHNNPRTSTSLVGLNLRAESDTAYIANNLFYRNYEHENYDNAQIIAPGRKGYCENNAIIGFDEADRFVAILQSANEDGYANIRNNIITGFKSAIYAYSYPDTTIVRLYYNNLWNNMFDRHPVGHGLVEFVVGNIREDPMFEDSTSYHLQMYSPCIDAGDPEILDVDGSRSDIGAFGGPLGQSYAYQDLPPSIPDSLSAFVEGDSIILVWLYNPEADFYRYQLHRDTVSGFEPSVFNLIAEPDTSYYVDTDWTSDHDYYYRISAVDNQENMSDYSEELAVILTSVSDFGSDLVARVTTIETNYPNPFNSRTIIEYYLADVGYQPATVKLYIYNIRGRMVRKLVDDRQYPGRHSVIWDGLDEGGESLSSGIYFARLIVSDIELKKPRKIVLIK